MAPRVLLALAILLSAAACAPAAPPAVPAGWEPARVLQGGGELPEAVTNDVAQAPPGAQASRLPEPGVSPVSPDLPDTIVPGVTATSYLVMDMDSGDIILQRQSHQELPPASLTKVMTALLVLEHGGL